MNETLMRAASWAAGGGLGALFFGGLFWTVQRGLASKRPALFFLASSLLRTGVVLSGFYFVSDGRWERLLLCLLGFVMASLLVTRLTRPSGDSPTGGLGVSHAP